MTLSFTTDTFEDCCSGILQNVFQFRFVWCFLIDWDYVFWGEYHTGFCQLICVFSVAALESPSSSRILVREQYLEVNECWVCSFLLGRLCFRTLSANRAGGFYAHILNMHTHTCVFLSVFVLTLTDGCIMILHTPMQHPSIHSNIPHLLSV